MDKLTPQERSRQMSLVRSKNTKPELIVRKLVHGMGYRYRLHRRALPGAPDLVFPSRKKVIFVHGCFWHQHYGCKASSKPKSNQAFWEAKLEGNRSRDAINQDRLRGLGWGILVLWECEIAKPEHLPQKIREFLG